MAITDKCVMLQRAKEGVASGAGRGEVMVFVTLAAGHISVCRREVYGARARERGVNVPSPKLSEQTEGTDGERNASFLISE